MELAVIIRGVAFYLFMLCVIYVKGQDPSSECQLDDDLTNTELERCQRRAERFLNRYLHAIRDETPWDKCGTFAEFESCLRPLRERCGSLEHIEKVRWMTSLYDALKCSCSEEDECRAKLDCFEREYGGQLSRRCDDYYRFNIKQRTMRKCHFIQERVRCKEALVTSSCGEKMGLMAFHIFKHQARDYISRRSCDISRDDKYTGFQYTRQCSADVPARMAQCQSMFLGRTRLRFRTESDLVATGRHWRKKINHACRDFRKFEECVEPLQDRCPEVVHMIYEHDGRSLRTYTLKMDYICNEQQEEYSRHLLCYRDVLDTQKQKEHCDHIWEVLKPMLRVESSFNFYCRPDSNHSSHIHSLLRKLTSCYHDVFRDACGREGGETMNGLMMRAFQDPVYLRFRFRPDCILHKPQQDSPMARTGITEKPHKSSTHPPEAKPSITIPHHKPGVSQQTYSKNTPQTSGSARTNFYISTLVWTFLLLISKMWSPCR